MVTTWLGSLNLNNPLGGRTARRFAHDFVAEASGVSGAREAVRNQG